MLPSRILIVRLGAMGDIVHALPAAATLKHSFPSARISWAIEPKWTALLEDNPHVDEVLTVDRGSWVGIRSAWKSLRRSRFDLAFDLQGLVKSGLVIVASGARRRVGFDRRQAREPIAALFYNRTLQTTAAHVVDRNLELLKAAGVGRVYREFPLPAGRSEGELPEGRFVLACPLAGWPSKQWPLEYYSEIGAALREEGCSLVVNGQPSARDTLAKIRGAHVHVSGIAGLIDATRRAAGVIGIDSGPLHVAAAIGRPGVAVFGPTDPARNGPYGATITVLRDAGAITTYKREPTIAGSMRAVRPPAVMDALRVRLAFHSERTGA